MLAAGLKFNTLKRNERKGEQLYRFSKELFQAFVNGQIILDSHQQVDSFD